MATNGKSLIEKVREALEEACRPDPQAYIKLEALEPDLVGSRTHGLVKVGLRLGYLRLGLVKDRVRLVQGRLRFGRLVDVLAMVDVVIISVPTPARLGLAKQARRGYDARSDTKTAAPATTQKRRCKSLARAIAGASLPERNNVTGKNTTNAAAMGNANTLRRGVLAAVTTTDAPSTAAASAAPRDPSARTEVTTRPRSSSSRSAASCRSWFWSKREVNATVSGNMPGGGSEPAMATQRRGAKFVAFMSVPMNGYRLSRGPTE
jgi:hypothetical protein